MFSWFLKLLGIDEDRPTASGNSYLNTNAASTKSDAAESAETKTAEKPESAPEPKPAPKPKPAPEPKPAPKPEEVPDAPAKVTESESAPAPEAEPVSSSLTDEFPGLKANYVKVLEEAGFTTKTLIDKTSDKDLLALKGIGKATLKIMRG